MKNIFYTKRALFLLACLVFLGCSKDDLFNYSDLEHNADWILPVVKTRISAEQVSKLNDLKYDVGAFTADITSFVNPSFPVPPISGQSIGPLDLDDTDSIYVRFRADTADLKVCITNNFPMNIKAGTMIKIFNSVLNTDTIFTGMIQNDIPGKGGTDAIIVTRTNMPWADNQLKISLENFTSDGTNGTVEDFSVYNNIDIKIGIDVIHLNEVELYGNIDYLVSDTSDFSLGSNPNEPEEEDIESVKLNLFIENGVPVSYAVKGYFLDANYTILDSLFGEETIPAPSIDGSGYVINSTIVEHTIVSSFTKSEYLFVKDNAQYIYYKLQFTSGPNNVRVINSNNIKLQLTADLKTKVSL